MTVIDLEIDPRPRDLGGFVVRRVLPYARRRMVGPFIFFDHIGPVRFEPGRGIDVRPHPHIGLATVTYLFEGEIVHRDSLGYVQTIRAGDVNWMTAGRGIVHSERTGPEARAAGAPLHGIQSWVALPRAAEETAPSFHHHPAATLPMVDAGGATLRLIAGRGWGATSPVTTASGLFYADAAIAPGGTLELDAALGERAVHVVDGSVRIDAGREVTAGRMLVLRDGATVTVAAPNGARVIALGGAPLDGERHIWWNFVSSSLERIEQAKRDWEADRFGRVPGDDERIPLPPA